MTDFVLTDNDKVQSLWLRLHAHLETQLDAARRRNDAPQSEHETATLRGEIRCLKKLIGLGASRPVTDADE